MRIDLKQIRQEPGGALPFEFNMDLADIEKSAVNPVAVTGVITNLAGVLLLEMNVKTDLSLICDRCAKQYVANKKVRYEAVIAESSEDEKRDDIIVCSEDALELRELALTAFILELDSKNLCHENCKGLCPTCGADLNEAACSCPDETIAPRLEKLKELL